MKSLFLIVSVFLLFNSVNAQTMGNLWGMTSNGGTAGYGVLFMYNPSTSQDSMVQSFTGLNGLAPYGSLIQASDGNLYGITKYGGTYNNGTSTLNNGAFIKYNLLSGTITLLQSFSGEPTGANPLGNLIQGSDGNFYGMTNYGGLYEKGAIFQATTSGTINILYNFMGTTSDGASPYGSLIQASDGNLYGMTSAGGSSGFGTIFKCTTSGVVTLLHSFSSGPSDGAIPLGSLLEGSDGKLYGMTGNGGASGFGTIFSCTTTGVETLLYSFSAGTSDGANPDGSLLEGSDGKLYGMTSHGGSSNLGTIFSYTSTGVETLLHSFSGGNSDGANVLSSLIQGNDGNLYGMTYMGGTSNKGTLFQCSTSGVYNSLLSFNNTNGSSPEFGDLIEVMSTSISMLHTTCNGSILHTLVRGGKSPYTYVWSTGATTPGISDILSDGKYYVAVTDSKGITVSDTITIVVPSALKITVNSVSNISCLGCADGSASVNITGGYKNSITWSDSTSNGYTLLSGHSADTIKNLTEEIYKCTVTDSCNNQKIVKIHIALPLATLIEDAQTIDSRITIYPIPNNGKYTIFLKGTGYQSLTIYNGIGEELLVQPLRPEEINNSIDIDITKYAGGAYFANIVNSEEIINKKILIQK